MDGSHGRLDRRVLALWWTIGGLCAGAVAIAALIVAILADPPPLVPVGIALVAIAIASVVPPLRYRRWRYAIRERDLSLAKGALFFVQTLIPFDRIQFVESRQGPMDRLFGLYQLIVYTAAGRAGTIPGLNASEAESVREELSRVAGTLSV
ncbi:MAG: PH domain-containing protein [Actinobacteria bacterium]|nr:PH domain-containing protein [Actinomycetota bacterium]